MPANGFMIIQTNIVQNQYTPLFSAPSTPWKFKTNENAAQVIQI